MAYSISFTGTYDGATTALLDSPYLDLTQDSLPGILTGRSLSAMMPSRPALFVVDDINDGIQMTQTPTGLANNAILGFTLTVDFNQTVAANCPPQLPVPNQQLYPRRV